MKHRATVYLVFLVMGFGDLIGPLVSLVKQQLSLTQFEASFIAFAGFIMFGTLSVPTGIFQARWGKRITVFGGLFFVLSGLALPLVIPVNYPGYLAAVMLIGAGVTILQVAASPLLKELSPPGTFAWHLTMGQFIKGIGTLSSPLIPFLAFRYFSNRWEVVFIVFAALTVVTLIIFSAFGPRAESEPGAATTSLGQMIALLKNRRIGLLVFAIFLYVGAEVSISSALPVFLSGQSDIGMAGVGLFFLALMSGRFAGTVLLKIFSPRVFLIITCLVSLAGLIALGALPPSLAFIAVSLVGFGFANIFPLVFSLAIDEFPEHANALSGLMVTAIAGGAILPPVMGYASDHAGLKVALAVPVVCIVYVLFVGFARPVDTLHAAPKR
ncbi:MAG: MFS transporter [Turneriella sp.]